MTKKANKRKTQRPRTDVMEGNGDEVHVIYSDIVTFLMLLFILLFVLSNNEGSSESFFAQVQSTFSGKKAQRDISVSADSIILRKLRLFLNKNNLRDKADIVVDTHKIKLILPETLIFPKGKFSLSPSIIPILNSLYDEVLKYVNNPISIEGHTDNKPVIPNTDYSSNFDLSYKRAYTVFLYYIEKKQASPDQYTASGYGEKHPLVDNTTKENRSKNRRIEISIVRNTSHQ